MAAVKQDRIPVALVRLRERFGSWRATRPPGTRIPEDLWREAAKLAATQGVSRAANVLGVSYYSLKERVEAISRSGGRSDFISNPAFVELLSSTPTATAECQLEFEDGAGKRIRLHWKGCQGSGVVALGRVFREGE
jgi:hypothetical protein